MRSPRTFCGSHRHSILTDNMAVATVAGHDIVTGHSNSSHRPLRTHCPAPSKVVFSLVEKTKSCVLSASSSNSLRLGPRDSESQTRSHASSCMHDSNDERPLTDSTVLAPCRDRNHMLGFLRWMLSGRPTPDSRLGNSCKLYVRSLTIHGFQKT